MVAGDTLQAHAIYPHAVPPVPPFLQLEEPEGPTGPQQRPRNIRVAREGPAWVTAGTFPASFLPGEARAAPRLMQLPRNGGWQDALGLGQDGQRWQQLWGPQPAPSIHRGQHGIMPLAIMSIWHPSPALPT